MTVTSGVQKSTLVEIQISQTTATLFSFQSKFGFDTQIQLSVHVSGLKLAENLWSLIRLINILKCTVK